MAAICRSRGLHLDFWRRDLRDWGKTLGALLLDHGFRARSIVWVTVIYMRLPIQRPISSAVLMSGKAIGTTIMRMRTRVASGGSEPRREPRDLVAAGDWGRWERRRLRDSLSITSRASLRREDRRSHGLSWKWKPLRERLD